MCLKKLINLFFGRKNQCLVKKDKCILAVEDDETQRTMIKKTLEKDGYRVIIATDGKDGVAFAKEFNPDLIILDVLMPDTSGQDVCKILKSDEKTKNTPIIFLTSLDTPADVIKSYDLGADVHLTKPIDGKELLRQVSITLQQRA